MTAWLLTFAILTAATTLALSVAFGWRVTLQHLDSDQLPNSTREDHA